MKHIGILCASDTELAPFLEHIQAPRITQKAMLKFYAGTIHRVNAVGCGIHPDHSYRSSFSGIKMAFASRIPSWSIRILLSRSPNNISSSSRPQKPGISAFSKQAIMPFK